MRTRFSRRLPLVQLLVFVAIGAFCTIYLAVTAVGPAEFRAATHVTVELPDAGGISPGAPVTYHGVRAGSVDAVRLRADGQGVDAVLSVDGALKIPASAEVVIAQDTAVALKHLDLRPGTDSPPYLTDGSTIHSGQTSAPVPLQTVLVNLMKVTDSVNLDDVSTIADELSAGLDGTAPQLENLTGKGSEIIEALNRMRPSVTTLLGDAKDFLGEGTSARLPKLVDSLSRMTRELRDLEPQAAPLLDKAPGLVEQVIPLVQANAPGLPVLLANLVSASDVIAVRTPALAGMLTDVPKGLGDLAKAGRGDHAAMTLVLAQGGICYYPAERRPPTDTTPRDPALDFHCTGGQTGGLGVRGAANAPRPPGTPAPVAAPGSPPREPPPGTASWPSLYLQGAR
ncbi:MlaD family protein [Amycolatopsis sp. NPDC059027]|uniref:MlaD family protein n=1 Tax=unclassified Amycolatopsis TaxID=2618356 RepID=UPI00366F86FF